MSNELRDIIRIFGNYEVLYDNANKVIIIRKPIHPRDFHFFRNYVLRLKDGVKDIIVGRYNYKKRGM